MEAAETYAKVAPAAGHALHMPSHIFVAQGRWDEVVASNIDSYQASVDRMKSKNLDNDARGYHAYHWLEYGYLQRGEFEIAADMLDSMVVYAAATPSKQSRSYLVRLQGTYLVETNTWDGPYADIQVDGSDLSFYIKTKHYFVEAMKSYTKRDVDSLRATRDLLEASIRRESLFADTIDFKLCIPSDLSAATPSDIAISKAVLFQLYALEYMLSGQNELAEDYLVKSTELEDSIDYSYGPPGIQKPTHELYADWLLSQKRNEEAVLHYEKELLRAPGRRLSTLGKTEAMKRISTAQTAGL